MGMCERRTQGARIAALLARLRTHYRAAPGPGRHGLSPEGRAGYAADKDAGSIRNSVTDASEDEVCRRPVRTRRPKVCADPGHKRILVAETSFFSSLRAYAGRHVLLRPATKAMGGVLGANSPQRTYGYVSGLFAPRSLPIAFSLGLAANNLPA